MEVGVRMFVLLFPECGTGCHIHMEVVSHLMFLDIL